MRAFKCLLIALLYVLYAPSISVTAILGLIIQPFIALCKSIDTIIEFLDD